MTDPRTIAKEIDAAVEGKSSLSYLERNAREYGDKPALAWKIGDGWVMTSWAQYREQAVEIAMGLRSLGVAHNDFVTIMCRNRPEHVIADQGVLHAAATPVSIYNTYAPEQIQYIADNCGAKVAILENREFGKRWEAIKDQLPSLTHMVFVEDADDFRHLGNVMSLDELREKGRAHLAANPGALEASMAEVKPEDPSTLIYTSGTTGPPKGVIITHRNAMWMMESVFRHFTVPMHLTGISYLPLAHVAERSTTYGTGLHRAGTTYFAPEMTEAINVAKEARPDVFLAVPRVWEKLKAGIEAGIAAETSPVKKALASNAISIAIKAQRAHDSGSPMAMPLGILRSVVDKVVLSKIRHSVGLDKAQIVLTGAAACAPDVLEFMRAIGISVLDTFGMSELTAVATIHELGKPKPGTVGVPLPGVELKIADDSEILVRGGNVTAGYWKRPDATAETFDAEGWVHSGDLGRIGPDGHLSIIGRKKELIITAGGKNISPNNIEALVKEHPLVGQVCTIGDGKKYLAAVVVLDAETAPAWAAANGLTFTDLASFSQQEQVVAEVQKAVDSANARLSRVESIKKFKLLPTEWTAESGELTPTLKLKRHVIHEKYKAEIDALYA